jgi:hypothetical protein
MASETEDNAPRDVSRRSVFKRVGAAGAAALAGAPFAPAVAQEHVAQRNPVTAAPLEALETLTATEADTLEAIVARLIPGDENDPGAAEARAAHYIDRALTGPLRTSRGTRSRAHFVILIMAATQTSSAGTSSAFRACEWQWPKTSSA